MREMIDALAARLKANPENGEGWFMLARSYRALGRLDAAVQAFGEAAKRLPNDPTVLTDWAEAIAQTQGRSLVGEPTRLLDQALAADANFLKALALRGSAAMEANDPATAATVWKRLRAQLPPDDPNLADIDAALAQAGVAPGDIPKAAAVPANAPPAMAAAGTTTPAAGAGKAAGSVEGRVELDPRLAGNAAPDDTVFIFARAAEGPRMPLAALRVKVSELPKAFTLTDDMAMTPTATLSKAGKVVIEARVSKGGNPAAQPGDLSGASPPIAPGARNVRVTIDHVVP
jgi:cytochrome c-type biogenesis protein CcmH